MTAGEDDWPAVAGNLVKAGKSLGAAVAYLKPGGGAEKRVSENFFKAVVQAVPLFGAET